MWAEPSPIRIFNFCFDINILFILNFQSSYVQSAKSRLKGPLAHDGDIQALHRSHNHGYRQTRNIGARISGRSRRFSHRRNIGNVFTPWTAWNSCDSNCKQRRERYCKVRRKCGQMKHLEERSCPQEL